MECIVTENLLFSCISGEHTVICKFINKICNIKSLKDLMFICNYEFMLSKRHQNLSISSLKTFKEMKENKH